jgi:excisionase family DNA binding protein
MQTIQLQVAITLDEDAAKALAAILAPALRQVTTPDDGREARRRISQRALLRGEELPEDQGLLIDSKEAARLLKVSARTLWKLQDSGEMPPPVRIGRAVRWSLAALKKWVEAKCPPPEG